MYYIISVAKEHLPVGWGAVNLAGWLFTPIPRMRRPDQIARNSEKHKLAVTKLLIFGVAFCRVGLWFIVVITAQGPTLVIMQVYYKQW